VADLLTSLSAGEKNTLVVVSSDLSHYLSSEAARQIDHETLHAIETLDTGLTLTQACGAYAINGLARFASQSGWSAMAIDRCDSASTGLTATDSVVGYGAVAYYKS